MRIDAHQHFWRYDPAEYGWIDEEMSALRRDFLPEHLHPVLAEHGFSGCIAVQARQTLEETTWLLALASEHSWIHGVVGWLNLCQADEVEHPKLVGIRHILQSEPDDEFMLRSDFIAGLRRLAERDLAFDLLIYPRHLPVALRMLPQVPGLKVVLDHCGKPMIREGVVEPWCSDLVEPAKHEGVMCKVSGLVTEAEWSSWQHDDLRRYLDVVFEAFGPDRIMFGSDWPVCLLASSYEQWLQLVSSHTPPDWHAQLFGENAIRFYGLTRDP